MGAYSVLGLLNHRSSEHRLDAAHGLAWSFQGLAGAGLVFSSNLGWLHAASAGLGVFGGTLQAGLGIARFSSGWRNGDHSRRLVGLLDLGAGVSWCFAATGIGAPLSAISFAGFTIARMVAVGHERWGSRLRQLGSLLLRTEEVNERTILSDEERSLVVVPALTKEQGERARRDGHAIIDSDGQVRAVVGEALGITVTGEQKPVVVIAPVEREPANPGPVANPSR
jgi:hypothetical protein